MSEKPEKNIGSSCNFINYKAKNNYKFFGNGTLFYLRNRLIKRHGIELGNYLFEYKLRSIKEKSFERKSIILRPLHHYSVA